MKRMNFFFVACAAVALLAGSTHAATISLPGLSTATDVVEAAPGAGQIIEGNNDLVAGVDGLNGIDFNSAQWTYTHNPAVNDNDWANAFNDGATDPGPWDAIGFTSGTVTHVSSVLMAADTTYTYNVDLGSGTGSDTTDDWDISIGANGVTLGAFSDAGPVPDMVGWGFDADNTFDNLSVSFSTGAAAPAGTSFGDAIEVSINSGGVDNRFVFINARQDTMTLTDAPVPEPASLALASLGLFGVLAVRRKR